MGRRERSAGNVLGDRAAHEGFRRWGPEPGTGWAGLVGRVAADPRSSVFLRGLAAGALVGAALAGSTIWGRLRRR